MHGLQLQREIELKFELDHRAAKRVRRLALLSKSDSQTRSQRTVYFDTNKGKLRTKGYSLRVRQVGDCIMQTVKTNGGSAGLFDRDEWEMVVRQMEPDLAALTRTPLAKFKGLDRLEPVVRSDVDRTRWMIDRDQSAIEVVLDSGIVSAGDQEIRFHELELELKDGEADAIFDLAQELSNAVPLKIGVVGKEERGLMLAGGRLGREHKASAPNIRNNMNAGQVLALLVFECVRHFRLNEAMIIADRDPQALHQARVAMRRLRTAFALFRPAIRQSSLELLRNELRQFIRPFGEARNLDVFLAHHGADLHASDRRKLESARANAYDQVIDTLNAQQSRDMFLDIVEWIASRDWQTDAASARIGQFAEKRLDAIWRKVKRKGSNLADIQEKQLHRLRIDIKKLRYAVEFLAALYPKKDVRKFTSPLERMQGRLGLMHDDMIGRQIVADLSLSAMAKPVVTGRSRQIKAMEVSYNRLMRVGRFWSK